MDYGATLQIWSTMEYIDMSAVRLCGIGEQAYVSPSFYARAGFRTLMWR